MKYCHGFVAGHIDFVKDPEAAPRSAFIDRTGTELDFPVLKVSVPSMADASMLIWKEMFHMGRENTWARFSARTFLPVALGPTRSKFCPHKRAERASSQTSLPKKENGAWAHGPYPLLLQETCRDRLQGL